MAGKRLVLCQFRSEVHVYGRPNWFKMTRYDITESISKMLAVNRLTRWLQAEAEQGNIPPATDWLSHPHRHPPH